MGLTKARARFRMSTTGKANHPSMKKPSRLIALYSPTPQCGKSTVANTLWLRGYRVVSFAKPLRNALMVILESVGVTHERAYAYLTDKKEEVIPELGVTGRHLLRTIGTGWGREMVHPDIWVMCARRSLQTSNPIVIDDLRLPNEAELVQEMGGETWLVTSNRPGFNPPDASHSSDSALVGWSFDRHLRNDGTLGEFHAQVWQTLEKYDESFAKC